MKKLLLTSLLLVLSTQVAHANCVDLALMFSESPDALEINELGELKRCVSDKLRSKLFSESESGDSPIPPLPAPAPAPDFTPAPAPPIMPTHPER